MNEKLTLKTILTFHEDIQNCIDTAERYGSYTGMNNLAHRQRGWLLSYIKSLENQLAQRKEVQK